MNPLESHLKAVGWEDSMSQLRQESEARAWKIAKVSTLCSGLTLLSLAGLIPLKQVVPYVVAVDRATGQTEIVSVGSLNSIPNRSLQSKYWVTQYVRARERFDSQSALIDFDEIRLWSARDVYTEYAKRFQGDSALQRRFAKGGGWRVTVLSIGLVDDHHAVVRIERAETGSPENASPTPVRFTADVTFDFNPPVLGRERELLENPMGFHVTDYRLDPELVELGPNP